jgi:hypothetical protein
MCDVAVCALTLCAALLVMRAWGPGRDGAFDSAFYVDGARHLAAGAGYVSALTEPESHGFAPITRWAPGFSLLIACGMALGLSVLDAAALVLALSYAAAVALVALLGLNLMGRRCWPVSVLAALTFAVLPATLGSADALLSDLPFATFALLAELLALAICRATAPSLGLRVAFGSCLGSIFLLRYAGALFAPGLLLATAWNMRTRRRAPWRTLLRLIPSVGAFVVIVASWIARNRTVGPEAFGTRAFESTSIAEHLARARSGALSWALQLASAEHSGAAHSAISVALWLTAACCLVLLAFCWRRAKRGLMLLVIPGVMYFGTMVLAASRMHFNPIDHPRFWVPLWPLMFLTALTLAARARRRWLLLLRLEVVLMVALTAAVFTVSAKRELALPRAPHGLLAERWRRASTLLPEPSECRLFVMDARPFMLHRALGPTSHLPLHVAEFEQHAPRHPSLCIAVLTSDRLRLSTTAQQRRPLQAAVVADLVARDRLVKHASGKGVAVYRLR